MVSALQLELVDEPHAPRVLFPNSAITIEKRYFPTTRFARKDLDTSLDIAKSLHLVPPEAPTALRRLARGDYKQFAEVHLESAICSQIVSACREAGPRILYSITDRGGYIEIYSECFDVELALVAMLGDIARAIPYEAGYRDGVRFRRALIPTALLRENVIELIEGLTERISTLDIRVRTFHEALNAIASIADIVSEVIVSIPCLNDAFLREVVPILAKLVERGVYVVFVTRPPHEADISCVTPITRYLLLYIETMSRLEECGVRACYGSITETSIVIDRSTVITTYESSYVPYATTVTLNDYLYAQNLALTYLKTCVCSSNLVKEDRR